MAGEAALSCTGVTKRFGRFVALSNVALRVPASTCVTLFGHNGAGKSTLLNISCGLIRSYEGSVDVFGVDQRTAGDNQRAAIGFVSHQTFLYDDLTARDNLRFWARLYGVRGPVQRTDELLERFDLTAKAGATVRSLSRGMKQRMALARALVHQPQLLLLDEPYTGLDEAACEMLSALIRGFVGAGGSALVTTHDIDRGLGVADRVSILDRGRLVYDSPRGNLTTETFRQHYRKMLSA